MKTIDALHGRARLGRAIRSRRWIVALCLVAMSVLTLEQLARIDVFSTAAGRGQTGFSLLLSQTLALVLGPAIGGLLIDRLGVKRVVALALIGWCSLTTLGAVVDPVIFTDLAPIATNVLPGLMFTGALVATRLSLATRRRGLAIALLVVAFNAAWPTGYPFDLYVALFGRADPNDPTGWQYPMFALAAAGAALVAIWLVAFPTVSGDAGLDLRPMSTRPWADQLAESARLVGNPAVWGLVAIQFCAAFVQVHALDQFWNFELARQGAIKTAVLATVVGIPVAYVVAASWSDRVYRSTRSFLAARRPFIVAGFLAAAAAPVVTVAPERSQLALTLIVAAGIGAARLSDLLLADLAPRRGAGIFIGTILTGEIASAIAINWFVMRPSLMNSDARAITACVVALIGAALAAATPPIMHPQDDRARETESPANYF